jgi:aspartate-semialdehyde dehydrogenase
VVQPASTQDDPGIEELFEGTRAIVAMTGSGPTPVYGAQLAFNLLPAAAEELPLAALLQKVLPEMPPIPVQVLQGGVFHGVAASLHVRFGVTPSVKALQKALKTNPHVEIAADPLHLGPVAVATSDKVLLGTIRPDNAGGFWFWAVMDNLTRGAALNAIEVAEAVGG